MFDYKKFAALFSVYHQNGNSHNTSAFERDYITQINTQVQSVLTHLDKFSPAQLQLIAEAFIVEVAYGYKVLPKISQRIKNSSYLSQTLSHLSVFYQFGSKGNNSYQLFLKMRLQHEQSFNCMVAQLLEKNELSTDEILEHFSLTKAFADYGLGTLLISDYDNEARFFKISKLCHSIACLGQLPRNFPQIISHFFATIQGTYSKGSKNKAHQPLLSQLQSLYLKLADPINSGNMAATLQLLEDFQRVYETVPSQTKSSLGMFSFWGSELKKQIETLFKDLQIQNALTNSHLQFSSIIELDSAFQYQHPLLLSPVQEEIDPNITQHPLFS